MKKVKEKTQSDQYAISIRNTPNGYYESRLTLKLGGGRNPRLQKGGKTEEIAVIRILKNIYDTLIDYYNKGLIFMVDEEVSKGIVVSLNELSLANQEILENLVAVVNLINFINNSNNPMQSVQPRIMPYNNPSSNLVPITKVLQPSPFIINGSNQFNINKTANIKAATEECNLKPEPEHCIIKTIEEVGYDWIKFKFEKTVKTPKNPNPLSRKTVDGYHRIFTTEILAFYEKKKKKYLVDIDEDNINALLDKKPFYDVKRNIYIVLNMFLAYARKQKYMKNNPLENLDKPVKPVKTTEEEDIVYIEPDRQKIWLNYLEQENTDMSFLFFTMLLTGLRPEEACRLEMDCIRSR